jgi:hypothetical protein
VSDQHAASQQSTFYDAFWVTLIAPATKDDQFKKEKVSINMPSDIQSSDETYPSATC